MFTYKAYTITYQVTTVTNSGSPRRSNSNEATKETCAWITQQEQSVSYKRVFYEETHQFGDV